MSYFNDIWDNNYASNVKCLCIIQRKAVRLICNADRLARTNELFKELYILKFPELYLLKSEDILYFNLLLTVLLYSTIIPCFHMFATLQ